MNNKNIYYIIVILVLSGVIVWLLTSNQYKKDDIEKYKNNISSLTTELDSFRTKNNELVYEKQMLILEKNSLEDYLNISKKEIKDLERNLDSKIRYISKIESNIKIDTLVMRDSVYIDPSGNTSILFEYDDKWLTLRGHSTQLTQNKYSTILDTLSMNVPLEVGLTDNYQIFVKTKCPYMNITNINGAQIEESKIREIKRRFGLGLYVGWGVQYGMINKTFDTGPQLGVGFYYRLF